MPHACHDVVTFFVTMLSHGLSWYVTFIVTSLPLYCSITWPVMMCVIMTYHDSVTWPVMKLSHDLSWSCHMTCHEVVTWPVTISHCDLSQYCHMTCHEVSIWPVMILSHDLPWCCHMTCQDVTTWPVMMSPHDLSCHMTCLSHDWHLYVFYFWHVPLKHGMWEGSTPNNLLWVRKKPSRIIEQHVNINLIEFCSSYQPPNL